MEISSSAFSGRTSAVPPLAASFHIEACPPEPQDETDPMAVEPLESIAGLTCVIEYAGAHRLISCRRFKTRGEFSYVGAICLAASGYREFRTDRIGYVFDPQSGEVLGEQGYFSRFSVDESHEARPTWGLAPSRRVTLVAGLNILAFMARCDGQWHPLETKPVEDFICSLWLRREWEGEPPLEEILAHAQRLSPDSGTFFKGVENYARSRTRSKILRKAVSDLIAADGVVCDEEFDWGRQFSEYLTERARHEGVDLDPIF
ncbi:hypothetical protein P6144_04980 [Sphingomonas sp. HITSZ_GF]|uniref:hypothetical protein n=1 Tax=Sphingomonas sp. HITSZ_GF TaxID=3037247 RepID=UPI00240E092C|nr:hypothetical protein [Sphingomonas sp. HITSZ_GF]MDG2532990.1 hypothetical protein [Sphingomonas sp. HITSZ_GF]